jgi:Methyltransferase domain
MLGIPVRYLLKHPLVAAELAASPVQVWTTVLDSYIARLEQLRPQCEYYSDRNWEQQLHFQLGVDWPCKMTSEFWTLWQVVISELDAKGIQAGPQSFLGWNDGDAGLVRAIWCLTRHLRPQHVVETGVAHGVTSRFILEALERNGEGHLWSIDLPPLERDWRKQVGIAVNDRLASRWSYIKGPSRLRLSKVLAQFGHLGLFVHDSLHSERNVRFELDRAWPHLRPGGAVVVDDIDANWGFRSFTENTSGHQHLIAEAEPLRPDMRRFNEKGLFGIILKEATRLGLAA